MVYLNFETIIQYDIDSYNEHFEDGKLKMLAQNKLKVCLKF